MIDIQNLPQKTARHALQDIDKTDIILEGEVSLRLRQLLPDVVEIIGVSGMLAGSS